jgi:signal transduction histidine kinase
MMYAAPFPVMAALLSMFFLTVSIGAVAYFLNVSATRENEVAFRESQHIVETAFSLMERDVRNWTKDYAWWDDTVHFANETKDSAWAEDNIGTYMQDTFDISGSFAVTPELETFFYSPRNENVIDDARRFLGKDGEAFLKQIQATSMESSIPMTSYVRHDNALYLVAGAAITEEHPAGKSLERHARPVLLLYRKLNDDLINEMSRQFLLRDLRVTSVAPEGASACIPLKDNGGNIIAYISWSPAKPGDQLYTELLPKISLISLLLVVTALLVFFAWWRTASQANAEKSRFLAKMSHELRTPLNPIVGFSSLMASESLGPIPSVYKSYAEDIHQCGIHLSAIIEDILDVSRIEAGEMSLSETEFDVAEVIRNLPAFTTRVPNPDVHGPHKLSIERVIEGNIPKLRADKLRVQQVLLNLVSNAVKFSDGKDIVIRARMDGAHIVIQVEDQGVGISAADMKLLFQPFVQVGKQIIENRSHGSGLGLIVSRELMRLHDGDVTLESEPGKGTVAIMRFPASRTVAAA